MQENRNNHWKITGQLRLFFYMIVYKLCLELGYWFITSLDTVTYRSDFNLLKYINGWICLSILFFIIQYGQKRASSFLLYLLYIVQIIPITVIYAMGNWQMVYYNILCFSVAICELIVCIRIRKTTIVFRKANVLSKLLVISFLVISFIVIGKSLLDNGLPAFTALDLKKVYDIREVKNFHISKYFNYLINWGVPSLGPFFIAKFLVDKKYFSFFATTASVLLIYLYTANKTFIFMLPVIIITYLLQKKTQSNYKTIKVLLALLSFLILCCILIQIFRLELIPKLEYLFNRSYDLIVRRAILDSANNKFFHFDFFSKNPKLGLSGIIPRWIFDFGDPYKGENYQVIIGLQYLKQPANHGTGFLAEGFLRFGLIGIPIEMTIFAFVLRLIDRFQARTSYCLAVSIFAYPIYALTDAHLLDNMLFGSWLFLLLILIFYLLPTRKKQNTNLEDGNNNKRICKSFNS